MSRTAASDHHTVVPSFPRLPLEHLAFKHSQEPTKFKGVVQQNSPQSDVEALQHALRELGYVEGHNVAFAWRFADTPEKYAPLAAELVALKVDVIVVRTGYMALAAQSATRNIPIVMVTSGDAVQQGLVASLARPRG